jgi:hypothetical protein
MNDEIIQCPCYHVCAALGVEMKRWCRYRKSDLPPPGMYRFDPKGEWCPAGLQANVLMLGYMLSRETESAERLGPLLDEVRKWARDLARARSYYEPVRANDS